MKTLLYENRAESKYISAISILLLAAASGITKLRRMHGECYIFANTTSREQSVFTALSSSTQT